MLKKCKVVMLPTNEKERRLYSNEQNNPNDLNETTYYHLYIISNDEIKEGDWFIGCVNGITKSYKHKLVGGFLPILYPEDKKIIATTDSSIRISSWEPYHEHPQISLPQPSQSFINVFVKEYNKGNVITDLMVEYTESLITGSGIEFVCLDDVDDNGEFIPKINSKDNTITIKRMKDSWNREEVINLLKLQYVEFAAYTTMNLDLRDKWIEKNI